MDNLGVHVVYRDKNLNPVMEKTYPLQDYLDLIRSDLLRVITDVEDMVYHLEHEKPREEWSDENWTAFCKIKHKLLDKAGDIERLPKNLVSLDDAERDEDLSRFVARVFNKGIDADEKV